VKVVLVLAFSVAFLCLASLVAKQRSILYVPVPPETKRSPKENPGHMTSPGHFANKLPFEDLMIETEDGVKINAWFIYHPVANCQKAVPYTFVYFHGNAGNIGHRMDNLKDMYMKLGINILILDYRAYGDSEDGSGPTEANFMKDAFASYRWLVDRIRNPPANEVTRMSADKIMFFGRSIGGCVATGLTAMLLKKRLDGNDKECLPLPAGVVLENSFTTLSDMAVTLFPFLSYLKPLLRWPMIFDEWRSADNLRYVAKHHSDWCCCLLSGMKDQVVPPAQMMQLASIIRENKPTIFKFFRFPNGGHNDTPTMGGRDYWESFDKFMKEAVRTEDERLESLKKVGLSPFI